MVNRCVVLGVVCILSVGLVSCSSGGGVATGPVLTSVAPAEGPTTGGTWLTLTGSNFIAGATVTVGGNAAGSVQVVSETTITCVTPAGTADATVAVAVTTSGGTSTLANAFTYRAPAPPAADLTGWWEASFRITGSGEPYEALSLAQMSQTGNNLRVNGESLMIDGSSIHDADPNETDPDRTVVDLTIVNENLVQGTEVNYADGAVEISVDLRLTRTTAPSGTLVASGEVEGETVAVNSLTGFAVLELDPSAFGDSSTLSLIDSRPTGVLEVWIEFNEELAPIATGTYGVAPWPAPISVEVQTASSWEEAASGSVTFQQFDAGQVRGNGTLELESGATFTFNFDVDIVITRDMSMD